MVVQPTPAHHRADDGDVVADDGDAVAAATVAVAGSESPIRSTRLTYGRCGDGESTREKRRLAPRPLPASDTSKSPVKKSIRTRRAGGPSRRSTGAIASSFHPIATTGNGTPPPSVVHPPGVITTFSTSKQGAAATSKSKTTSVLLSFRIDVKRFLHIC